MASALAINLVWLTSTPILVVDNLTTDYHMFFSFSLSNCWYMLTYTWHVNIIAFMDTITHDRLMIRHWHEFMRSARRYVKDKGG